MRCVHACVFAPVTDWECVLPRPRGKKKTVPPWFNYHAETELEGQQEARGDSTVRFTQVSWHRGWTKRPINSRNVHLQAWFHLSVFPPPLTSQSFFPPQAFLQPAPLTWHLIPQVSELIRPKFTLQVIASKFSFGRWRDIAGGGAESREIMAGRFLWLFFSIIFYFIQTHKLSVPLTSLTQRWLWAATLRLSVSPVSLLLSLPLIMSDVTALANRDVQE